MKFMGAAVLVLAFAAAAEAGGNGAHFTVSPSIYTQSGGGGIGGGATGGAGAMLHVPPARFAVREVSGNTSDYIPSTFVSYDSAVAEGDTSSDDRPLPLGTYAQESGKPAAKDAKIQIVQKQDGRLVIER